MHPAAIQHFPSKRSKKPAATLAEVARAAGVSVATVSRVLNGENKEEWAGAAARANKIRSAAKRLNYRPDMRAKSLRLGRTNSIGVLYSETLPMMDLTSYGPMFRAFGEIIHLAGYHMMFVHVPRTTGIQPATMLSTVDAAIFYHNMTEGELEAARVLRGPSILVNCEPKLPLTSVNPDEASGAAAVVKHLLALGHERIAFITMSQSNAEWEHHSTLLRKESIRREMQAAGLISGFISWEHELSRPITDVVNRFRNTPLDLRPTAMIVSYSVFALSIMNEMIRAGVKVPEKLSIVTFDDHALVAEAIVPMTTISVPMEEMGRTAASLILGLLQNPRQKTRAVILPEQLIVRQSSGPAAK